MVDGHVPIVVVLFSFALLRLAFIRSRSYRVEQNGSANTSGLRLLYEEKFSRTVGVHIGLGFFGARLSRRRLQYAVVMVLVRSAVEKVQSRWNGGF